MMNYSPLLIVLLYFLPSCYAKCTPSACGIFANLSSPFGLKGDSEKCGDRRFELTCENNVTFFSLNSHKYYVKAINYDNSTVRLVDASVNTNDICSFPSVSAYAYQFSRGNPNRPPSIAQSYFSPLRLIHLHLMRCPHPLQNSSLLTNITTRCPSGSEYTYVKVGSMEVSRVEEMCRDEVIVMTSWDFKDSNNVSLSEIHDSLLYGFELTVCPLCTATESLQGKRFIDLITLFCTVLILFLSWNMQINLESSSTVRILTLVFLILFDTYTLRGQTISHIGTPLV